MAKLETLQENFNFGGRDSGKWADPGTTKVSIDTDLNLKISTQDFTYWSLSSLTTYDLTASYAFCQLVNAGNQAFASLEVYPVHLAASGNNSVSIMVNANLVSARKKLAGVSSTVGVAVAYNSTTMKWFRIREAGGTTFWEYAADPTSTWTLIASVANPITVTAITGEVIVGDWSNAGLTTAIFDNFNVVPGQYQFDWKGYTWEKRIHAGAPANNQTWSTSGVGTPDGNGYITLSFTNAGSAPIGCEFYTDKRGFGYGTYMHVVGTRLDTMDHKIGWGGLYTFDFTLPPDYREIDTAEVRDYNSQANIRILHSHVYNNGGSGTFIVDDVDVNAAPVQTHVMKWEPRKITFDSYVGTGTGGLNYFHSEQLTNIPTPGLERIHFNIWSNTSVAGYATAPAFDVILRDFSFTPLPILPGGAGGARIKDLLNLARLT